MKTIIETLMNEKAGSDPRDLYSKNKHGYFIYAVPKSFMYAAGSMDTWEAEEKAIEIDIVQMSEILKNAGIPHEVCHNRYGSSCILSFQADEAAKLLESFQFTDYEQFMPGGKNESE